MAVAGGEGCTGQTARPAAAPRGCRGRKEPPRGSPGRALPCRPLGFQLVASRTVRRNFCCFKLPSLWHIVTAANRDDRDVGEKAR